MDAFCKVQEIIDSLYWDFDWYSRFSKKDRKRFYECLKQLDKAVNDEYWTR